MDHQDSAQLFSLLGQVIKQNETILTQNQKFLEFLRERDARVPERTELEIQRLVLNGQLLELEIHKAIREETFFKAEVEGYAKEGETVENMRVEGARLAVLDFRTRLGYMRKEIERLEKKSEELKNAD